jgi:hypothetical protein
MKDPWIASLAVACAVGVTACKSPKPPASQTQPLASPSGKYVLTLPIEKNTRNPAYATSKVWKVAIHDSAGALEYKDEDSTMVGYLNVYWDWDSKDRVWVYNSDNGKIHRWEKLGRTWTESEVNDAEKAQAPKSLLPHYAR